MARRIVLALLLAIGVTAQAPAAPAEGALRPYSVEEARLLGIAAIGSGRPDIAQAIAAELLKRDPDDPYAHFLLARARLDAGAFAEAQATARRAFRLARTPEQSFQSARLIAQAAWNRGHYPAAEWWLRRAAEAAPGPDQRAATLQELRSVRARNPLSVSLSFAVTPTDNVNNGAASAFNIIEGVPVVGWLSPDGQALSGTIVEAGAALRWRLAQDAVSSTAVEIAADMRDVHLSASARQAAPDARGSDFDSARLEVALRHRHRPTGAPWEASGQFALGAQTAAGSLEFRYARLGGELLRGFGTSTGLRLTAMAEYRDAPPPRPQGDTARSLQAAVTQLLPGEDRLTLAVYHSALRTGMAGRSSTARGVRLTWEAGRQIGPVGLSASLGYGETVFPGYRVGFIAVPGGRRDETVSASLDMRFSDLSWAGFAPRLTLSHVETVSNVSRFETRRSGLAFGIESRF